MNRAIINTSCLRFLLFDSIYQKIRKRIPAVNRPLPWPTPRSGDGRAAVHQVAPGQAAGPGRRCA